MCETFLLRFRRRTERRFSFFIFDHPPPPLLQLFKCLLLSPRLDFVQRAENQFWSFFSLSPPPLLLIPAPGLARRRWLPVALSCRYHHIEFFPLLTPSSGLGFSLSGPPRPWVFTPKEKIYLLIVVVSRFFPDETNEVTTLPF